jgi:hypothetical protein
MGKAPYQRSYQRGRPADEAQAADSVPNRARRLTDQGADPDPADLGWCIHRSWRVIYYAYRHAAGLPLWDGVDDFEILMADVLLRLSSAFEPVAPSRTSHNASEEKEFFDARAERVYQPSCRVYPTPVFKRREWLD